MRPLQAAARGSSRTRTRSTSYGVDVPEYAHRLAHSLLARTALARREGVGRGRQGLPRRARHRRAALARPRGRQRAHRARAGGPIITTSREHVAATPRRRRSTRSSTASCGRRPLARRRRDASTAWRPRWSTAPGPEPVVLREGAISADRIVDAARHGEGVGERAFAHRAPSDGNGARRAMGGPAGARPSRYNPASRGPVTRAAPSDGRPRMRIHIGSDHAGFRAEGGREGAIC